MREGKELPDVRVLHIYGGPQSPRVPGYIVGEDDGPHAGLARPRLAHQQHLLPVHPGICKEEYPLRSYTMKIDESYTMNSTKYDTEIID